MKLGIGLIVWGVVTAIVVAFVLGIESIMGNLSYEPSYFAFYVGILGGLWLIIGGIPLFIGIRLIIKRRHNNGAG